MKVLRVVAESPGFDDDDDLFMELTNGVIELVHAKRLDEAQQMCERLRDEFPECVDWLDRSAIVAEARGDLLAASDFYRRAAEFAAAQGGHDQELIVLFRNRGDMLAAKVASREEASA